MVERIEIPDAIWQVKANYPDFPSEALVEEIRAYILATGTPWLWHGHTHTPLPEGSEPLFVWDYEVPEFGSPRRAIAPCPHCSPTSPKYKYGVIAYFPAERVIRLMGMDCFKASNPEAYIAAKDSMKRFKSEVSDRRFLAQRAGLVDDYVFAAMDAEAAATAVDAFQSALRDALPRLALETIHRAIRGGELRVRATREVERVDQSGQSSRRTENVLERYASIASGDLFDPDAGLLAPRAKKAARKIEEVRGQLRTAGDPADMTAAERDPIVRAYSAAINSIRETYRLIDERRAILAPAQLATLREWGKREDAEASIWIEEAASSFRIGKSATGSREFATPRGLRNPLSPLPVG